MGKITTYNEKAFLLPDSIRSAAMYHAKVMETGEYMFRIHDCNTGIRLRGVITDPEQVTEAVEKLRRLAGAANEFADFIADTYRPTPSVNPDPRSTVDIITECAQACGFSYKEIVAKDRHEKLHTVRQLIYMRLRDEARSYSLIGRLFGRSHATIITAIRAAERLIAVNDPLIMDYKQKLEQ